MNNLKPAFLNEIKGIFFDYGGVLEEINPKEETLDRGISIIGEILRDITDNSIKIEFEKLKKEIKEGLSSYTSWYKKNNYIELSNDKVWTDFLLKDLVSKNPEIRSYIANNAENLSSILEFYLYPRRPKRGLKDVLKALFNMNYTLGIISNTISQTLIPERLEKLDINRYFSTVTLSVNVGIRKPRKEIFEYALKEVGLNPAQCIYVGDTLSRDVEGSRNAGFARAVLIESGLTRIKDKDYYNKDIAPDYRIEELNEILSIL